MTKTCAQCGNTFDSGGAFCRYCGHKLADGPTEPLDPLVGVVIDEKYRLDAAIGAGGMGSVYRATHLHMNATVAVKLLNKSLTGDQQAVERFRREAQAAARIRHPHAVSVTDFGVGNTGHVYIVMEYLEGTDLRARLVKDHVIRPAEAITIILQALGAIGKAHSKGVIHRDLKPDNIWLTRDEETGQPSVKVLDFGIAKLQDHKGSGALTQHGMIVGTPQYMSPEQVQGEELDARSDIYSLGIVLYEMLCGRPPFKSDNAFVIANKHVNERPRPIDDVNPDVPRPLAAAVMRALAKQRSGRPATAKDFALELTNALRLSVEPSDRPATEVLELDFDLSASPDVSFSPDMDGQTRPPTGDTAIQDSGPWRTATPVTVGLVDTTSTKHATGGSKGALVALAAVVVVLLVGVAAVVGILFMADGGVERQRQPANANVAIPPPPVDSGPTAPSGMVYVRGGAFAMGTDDASADAWSKPAHEVTVRPFFLDQYEVTNGEYARFVDETGRAAPWPGGELRLADAKLPVTNVTWYDAEAYARWAGKRLPTEAEWEYAARGADGRRFPWGNEWNPRAASSSEDGVDRPAPVGSYGEGVSPFGVYDMGSNVSEWVADRYAAYPNSSFVPKAGEFRVFRGGMFMSPPAEISNWKRFGIKPDEKRPYLGFRCAKDAAQ